MSLQLNGRITGTDLSLDSDIRDLFVATLPSGTFLYSITGQNGGLTAYALEEDGTLASRLNGSNFTPELAAVSSGALTGVTVDGTPQILIGGSNDRLVGVSLQDDGTLGDFVETQLSVGSTSNMTALASVTVSDKQFVYVIDVAGGELVTYGPGEGSGLTLYAAGEGASAPVSIEGEVFLASAETQNAQFLVTADQGEDTITSYLINPVTGGLQEMSSIGAADGLGIQAPTALEVVAAHGETWVILSAAGSGSLSVMHMDAAGILTPVDHVIDTLNTRFQAVQSLAVTEVDGHIFVTAAGADDGLTLFTLLPDGRLLHLETVVNWQGAGLENITSLTATRVGDNIQFFAGSGTLSGVSQLSMSIETLGDIVTDDLTGSRLVQGTDLDDILVGGADGTDTLDGGAGNDILVAGTSDNVLRGGSGADVFVMQRGGYTTTIEDFQIGVDRLDLSHFPMLRNLGQLGFTQISDRITLTYGDETVVLEASSGTPLTINSIFGSGFTAPDRLLVLATPQGLYITGTNAGEFIRGEDGPDEIDGGLGNDIIWTHGGSDTIFGGAGDDDMGGGGDPDLLWGGAGRDTIYGGDGNDTLHGEDGDDNLWAGLDDDQIFGGAGDDNLGGSLGDDTIWGGAGRDLIFGDIGDDTINGDADVDTLWAGTGNDRVNGGDDSDQLGGGPGRDTVFGDAGDDYISGHTGNDILDGGAGNDTIWGWTGHDQLRGGDGDDLMGGGLDIDRMTGGAGADTFVFYAGHGDDVITDFTHNEDLIHIYGAGLSFDTLGRSSDPNGDALLDYGTGTVLLEGLSADSLVASDFLFN